MLAGAVLVVVSCDPTPTMRTVTPETAAAEGFYALESVNDTVLPRVVRTDTDYRLEIVSDTIVLVADGRWADVTHYREVDGVNVTLAQNSISGAFTVNQMAITFTSTGGTPFAGVLDNGTLTINLGSKAVYRKE
ncbi:MAG: hypothetical protein ABI664_06085 [bacterium]